MCRSDDGCCWDLANFLPSLSEREDELAISHCSSGGCHTARTISCSDHTRTRAQVEWVVTVVRAARGPHKQHHGVLVYET